jgi:zinc protease
VHEAPPARHHPVIPVPYSPRLVAAATSFALLAAACVHKPSLPDAGLALGARSADARFDVEVAQTANGLRYALVPDARSNVVTIDVRYTVGAADDPAGKGGLAHLVEHLSYGHTASPGGPSLSQRLDHLALTYNAYTNWDETHYTATALAENLDGVLRIEADRMAPSCERLDKSVFERERGVVINEGRERGPDAVWGQVRTRLFGADHPYTHPVGGAEIGAIAPGDVCDFLAAHYAPARAILVVVGPIDAAATRAMITARFGAIQRTAGTQRELPAVVTTGESVLSADVDEPTAVIAFAAPPWGKKGNAGRDLVIDMWIRRAQGLSDDSITGIRRGYLGGFRGGVDLVTVTASHWSKLPAAVDAVFKAQTSLLADDFSVARRDLRSSHGNGALGQLEQFSGMGSRVADYLQYADHPWFMIQSFNEAESLWPEGVIVKLREVDGYFAPRLVDFAEDAPQLRVAIETLPARAATHIAWIQPDKNAPDMDAAPAQVPRVDVAEWKAPLETGDADRPLAVPATAPRQAPHHLTLPNGLRVVLAPIAGSPLVDIRVVFGAGTLNDPAQRPGLAMLTAYMLDHEVPDHLTADEYTRVFWAMGLGTRMSADTDEDTTVFRASGAARYADWHAWRLFWMLDQGGYDQDTLAHFRRGIKPPERPGLATVLATALVGPTQVHDPDPRLLGRITLPELETFRDQHYRPGGATLIITGGFDMATMMRIVPRLWGTWRGTSPKVPYRKIKAAPTGQRHLAIDDDEARQLTVAVAFPASTPDPATRAVVAEMVAAQVRSVRGRLGVTYGVNAEYDVLLDAAPALLITGEVDPARGGEAIRAMLGALDELRADPEAFTRAFVIARRRVLGRLLARISDTPALAGELESLVRSGWTRRDVDDVITHVAKLTPGLARDAIARDMVAGRAVFALSGRRAAIEDAYRSAGMPQPHFAGGAATVVSARP